MKIIAKNKRAYLDYDIKDTFEAWIVLKGYEVKSVKQWQADIRDAIVKQRWGELFVTNLNIPLYSKTSPRLAPWYDPKRSRKLLLHKKEIQKLAERIHKTWLVLIPTKIYINKKGRIKLEIALAKLRKKIEKKQIIKERDLQREAQRTIKNMKY